MKSKFLIRPHKSYIIKPKKISGTALVVKHIKIEPDGKIVNDSERVTPPGNNLTTILLQAKNPFRADSIVGINSQLTYRAKAGTVALKTKDVKEYSADEF